MKKKIVIVLVLLLAILIVLNLNNTIGIIGTIVGFFKGLFGMS